MVQGVEEMLSFCSQGGSPGDAGDSGEGADEGEDSDRRG